MNSNFPNHVKFAYSFEPPNEVFPITDEHGSKMYVHDGFYIKLLSEALKFSFSLIITNYRSGKMMSDGNWTGVLGMLQREEADLSVDGIAITEERFHVVDFSPPHLITDLTFLTHNPKPQLKNFAILRPFDPHIWITIAAFFFIVSVVFYIMKRRTKSYQYILLKVLGSLLEQDLQLDFRSWHKKFIVLSWIVGVMLLSYSYKAIILSFLSFPPLIGIRDIADLSKAVADGTHVCMTNPGSFVIDKLEQSPDISIRIIGKSLKENGFKFAPTEHLMKIEKPKSVIINPRVNLSPEQNVYYLSRDSFLMIMTGVAVRKSFCCKKKLNEVVRRISEAGLYEKFLRERDMKEFLKKRSHLVFDENITHILTVEQLKSPFILLLVGHLSATTVFIVEYFFGKRFRRSAK